MSVENEIFDREGTSFLLALRTVLPNLRGGARDWFPEAFQEQLRSSPEEAQYSYWCELLGRAYIAAAASLIRHDQWIKGIIASYQADSYLGLSGSLRGLLESAADSTYSLQGVPLTIANHWGFLRPLMQERRSSTMILNEELEEHLIHFVHARKRKANDEAPVGHRALAVRDYIDTLRKFDPASESLYCELVEIVHPAQESLSWIVKHETAGDHWLVRIGSSADSAKAICLLLDRYRRTLTKILETCVNLPLITLKTLRRLPLPDIDLSFMDTMNLDAIKAWRDIDAITKA